MTDSTSAQFRSRAKLGVAGPVMATSILTGTGIGCVALIILLDRSRGSSLADRVWAQSAFVVALLLIAAGISLLVSATTRSQIPRLITLAICLGTIGAATWGISAGLDLLCVRQHALTPLPAAVLTARISIAASAISGWVGLMGLLAAISIRTVRTQPLSHEPDSHPPDWTAKQDDA